MKKLIVSDYDQTFYINDQDIEKNKKAVNKLIESKNIFAIATGRSYFDFYKKWKTYKFNYNYAILNQGATIIDDKHNVLVNVAIENEIIPKLKKDLELDKSIALFCCSELESRVDFEHKNLTKIHVKYESKEDAIGKSKYINEKYANYVKAYYIEPDFIEIVSNKTDKSIAVLFIVKLNNVSEKDVYTIGNGNNDLEMIKRFNGFCIEGAVKEVKNCALKQYSSVSNMIEDILNNKI